MAHKESQYSVISDSASKYGIASLGSMSSFTWNSDPKRLCFVLSRYKAVASLLEDEETVLEIGCGDGFASRIVAQAVKKLTVSDFDSEFMNEAKKQSLPPFEYFLLCHNFLDRSSDQVFSSAYLLDVLEHIEPSQQDMFMSNIKASVKPYGRVIVGMPSLESQKYASDASKVGHVNCQTKEGLKQSLSRVFPSINVFSMNDEVLHTGFAPMSHYLLAICTC